MLPATLDHPGQSSASRTRASPSATPASTGPPPKTTAGSPTAADQSGSASPTGNSLGRLITTPSAPSGPCSSR